MGSSLDEDEELHVSSSSGLVSEKVSASSSEPLLRRRPDRPESRLPREGHGRA
jgi:hypothetical protein